MARSRSLKLDNRVLVARYAQVAVDVAELGVNIRRGFFCCPLPDFFRRALVAQTAQHKLQRSEAACLDLRFALCVGFVRRTLFTSAGLSALGHLLAVYFRRPSNTAAMFSAAGCGGSVGHAASGIGKRPAPPKAPSATI